MFFPKSAVCRIPNAGAVCRARAHRRPRPYGRGRCPPSGAPGVEWHHDNSYGHLTPYSAVSCLLALDDIEEDMGPRMRPTAHAHAHAPICNAFGSAVLRLPTARRRRRRRRRCTPALLPRRPLCC